MLRMSSRVSCHNSLRKMLLRPSADVLNVVEAVTLTVQDHCIEHRKGRFAVVIGGEPVWWR